MTQLSINEKNRHGKQDPRVRVEPKRTHTDGEDAAELVKAYAFELFPWQKLVLNCWMGRDETDHFSATSVGLAVPRQNGKNALLEARELYGLVVNGEKILHTAHQVKTSKKAFNRLAGIFEDTHHPELNALVVNIRRTNGEEAIHLSNGGSIEYSARSRGAARGWTVDTVVYDEAQELTDEQVEAILPTLAAAPSGNRQFIYTGTPPGPNAPGEVFRRVRKTSSTGADPHAAWHEWSVEEIGDVTDVNRWYETNPSLGYLLTEDFTRTELGSMSPDGFARERLGWWSENSSIEHVFSQREWAKCKTSMPPKEGVVSAGVKFSPDGKLCTIAVCKKPSIGKPHIECVLNKSIEKGVGWVADWLLERSKKLAMVAIDGRVGVQPLITKLSDGGFPRRAICLPTTTQFISAISMLVEAVHSESVTHFGQPALDSSATLTAKRQVGDAFAFQSTEDADATLIEACALAYWQAMTTRRKPGKGCKML